MWKREKREGRQRIRLEDGLEEEVEEEVQETEAIADNKVRAADLISD